MSYKALDMIRSTLYNRSTMLTAKLFVKPQFIILYLYYTNIPHNVDNLKKSFKIKKKNN